MTGGLVVNRPRKTLLALKRSVDQSSNPRRQNRTTWRCGKRVFKTDERFAKSIHPKQRQHLNQQLLYLTMLATREFGLKEQLG